MVYFKDLLRDTINESQGNKNIILSEASPYKIISKFSKQFNEIKALDEKINSVEFSKLRYISNNFQEGIVCELVLNSKGDVKNLAEIFDYIKNDAMFKRFFSSIKTGRWSQTGISNPTIQLTFNPETMPEIKDFLEIIKQLSDKDKEKLFEFISSNIFKNYSSLFSTNFYI